MTETPSANSMQSEDSRLISQEYRQAILKTTSAFNLTKVLGLAEVCVYLTTAKTGKILCSLKTSEPVPKDFFNPLGGYFWTVVVCLNAAGSAASSEDAKLLVKAEMTGIDIFHAIALFTKKVVKYRENHQCAWSDVMEEISEAYMEKKSNA